MKSQTVKEYWKLLRTYMRPHRNKLILLVVLILGATVVQLWHPQILKQFIDKAMTKSPLEQLVQYLVIFLFLVLIGQVLNVVSNYTSKVIGYDSANKLRIDLIRHTSQLDMKFYNQYEQGKIIERAGGDVDALSNFFSSFVISFVANFLLIIGILSLLFRESTILGIAFSVFVIVALFLMNSLRKFVIPLWMKIMEAVDSFNTFILEHIASTEDVRSNGGRRYVFNKFFRVMQVWRRANVKGGLAGYLLFESTVLLFALGNTLALALSLYLWNTQSISIGTIYLIFAYTELLRNPIERIREQMEDFQSTEASIMRIKELLDTKSSILYQGREHLPHGPVEVEFKNVFFSYDEAEQTLSDISFVLQPGKRLGIVGKTGSGKTTLIRLLFRFYNPVSGHIKIANKEVGRYEIDNLRENIGYISQDIQLLNATVRDNLVFYNQAIPDKDIIRVLSQVGLGNWLEQLPNGLDTEIEPGALGLSSGETQLFAISRVMLTKPKILILDEASSKLDPITEKKLEVVLEELFRDKTVLIIAHKLKTLEHVDEILMLNSGYVIEHGSRTELLKQNSYYKTLVENNEKEGLIWPHTASYGK
nr:ABC transporter ATP-binding protein [Paenibacillus xylanexedens]